MGCQRRKEELPELEECLPVVSISKRETWITTSDSRKKYKKCGVRDSGLMSLLRKQFCSALGKASQHKTVNTCEEKQTMSITPRPPFGFERNIHRTFFCFQNKMIKFSADKTVSVIVLREGGRLKLACQTYCVKMSRMTNMSDIT